MSLIKKANELNIDAKIKALIYGQAGTGKSTLAISAPKPLLFDFDGGVHRINYAHLDGVDTVQIENYQNFIDVLDKEDLKPYETLVIDTGGKLLDYMGEYITKKNSKMGRANGMLTLQGYGERKAMFSALIKKISIMGKHLVFVAHRETRQDGDDMRYVPLFGGSNYDSLVTELDLVGYMEAVGRKRTITFDPTSRNDGKNTCNLPSVMDIPTITDEHGNPVADNNFLSVQVIEPYIRRLKDRIVDGEKYREVVELIKSDISVITDADLANDFVARIDDYDHIGSSKEMARSLLKAKTDELNLKWVKGKGYEI